MSLQIKPNYIENLDDFEWKEWRASMITREKRTKGDFYFAQVVRYFGIDEETEGYDVGDKKEDFAFLGRYPIAIGDRVYSKDPKKPGVREYVKPVWEEIENQVTKEKTRHLKVGHFIWKYSLPVNEENTERMRNLVGETGSDSATGFQIIEGSQPPVMVTQDELFTQSVADIKKRQDINNFQKEKIEQEQKVRNLDDKVENAKSKKS